LVVAPYYNRPSQEGLLAHFSYLAEKIDLPIVLYNVPARTVTDIKPETVVELARRFPDRIIGIKDASGDLSRVTDHRMGIARDFCQLSGDDELALPFNAAGGVGCISVTANVAPRLCADFQAACANGNVAEARRLNDLLYPVHYAMFEDASPGPVKYALSRVFEGLNEELRLPMVPCNAKARAAVDAALIHAGLVAG
jgi:4-hydroxy-tetrahydrodipicolinate synthase